MMVEVTNKTLHRSVLAMQRCLVQGYRHGDLQVDDQESEERLRELAIGVKVRRMLKAIKVLLSERRAAAGSVRLPDRHQGNPPRGKETVQER